MKKYKIKIGRFEVIIAFVGMNTKTIIPRKRSELYRVYSEKYTNSKPIDFEIRKIKGIWIWNFLIGIHKRESVGIANSQLL